MSQTYTQCLMRKADCEFTGWIPSKFALAGKVLDFKDMEAKGWTVSNVFTTLPEAQVLNMEYVARQYHELLEGN